MDAFVEKLSSYHILNYLLTGILFVVLAEYFTQFNFIKPDPFLAPFVYYFYGLVLSRIGSLVIQPVLKKIKAIEVTEYHHYITAAKADPHIAALSETNNMYRTLSALFLTLFFLKVYALIENMWPIVKTMTAVLLPLALFAMFIVAYRKQTNYITDRIETNLKGHE